MTGLTEFDLIDTYFRPLSTAGGSVVAGIGDDCALLTPAPGCELAISTDTCVAGVHFPPACEPSDLAWRGLAAAASDLAAMGARPLGFTLALTLPAPDAAWLRAFSDGLAAAAAAFGLPLLGGDTTRGPMTLGWTVLGEVPAGAALRRGGARAGDLIVVSGELGDAHGALAWLDDSDRAPALVARYWHPQPRLALGQRLLELAHAAIDISDGLLADLGHILKASGVGAELRVADLPLSDSLVAALGLERARLAALTGGDDYELCFTLPPQSRTELARLSAELGLRLSVVGKVLGSAGLHLLDEDGRELSLPVADGYQHFEAATAASPGG